MEANSIAVTQTGILFPALVGISIWLTGQATTLGGYYGGVATVLAGDLWFITALYFIYFRRIYRIFCKISGGKKSATPERLA